MNTLSKHWKENKGKQCLCFLYSLNENTVARFASQGSATTPVGCIKRGYTSWQVAICIFTRVSPSTDKISRASNLFRRRAGCLRCHNRIPRNTSKHFRSSLPRRKDKYTWESNRTLANPATIRVASFPLNTYPFQQSADIPLFFLHFMEILIINELIIAKTCS